jgi:protein-S-isoprenylcysteine O-methyltransferase Ste14
MFLAMLVVPALDHRLHWSTVPLYGAIAGDVLVALGFLVVFFVYRENSFASATIEIYFGQKVVSTGLYALVRHPMYMGAIFLLVGMPLALGSWWGLVVYLLFIPALIWRILDEEKFLTMHLPGYADYKNKVKCRLMPFIW